MKTLMNYVRKASLLFCVMLISGTALLASFIVPSKVMAAPFASAGATLPYVELEAEDASTNGTIIGPDRTKFTLAGESQGRRAVTLNATGQYVQFTLPSAANSIVVRYNMPDSSDGVGINAPLSLYINGVRQTDLSLTSHYAWQYGPYGFDNNPAGGGAHRFYDETRMQLSSMAAGATVKLQKDSTSTAASYTIDFVDFEQVPAALTQPGGSTSVVTYGADPSGATDSTTAIQNAVNTGGTIWIPAGTYKVTGHINVGDNVTIKGAGMWYTGLYGLNVGIFAPDSPARNNVHVSDLALMGDNTYRIDSNRDEAIGGSWTNSGFSNIWVEHTKSGIWPQTVTNATTFTGFRIRDTYADGVNFWGGVANTTVTQSSIRNTGDDGMAMFSTGAAGHDNTFSYNTVGMPSIANTIGVYGGYNNTISNNLLMDTLWNGDGIQIANRFGAVAMSGTTTITGNRLLRTGSYQYDKNWPAGAILFYAEDSNMTGTVNVTNNEIIDSNYAAMQFAGSNVTNVSFNTNTITGAGTYGLQVQSAGSASFTSVTATLLGVDGTYKCGTSFTINQGSGNSGWNTTPVCPGSWPAPVYQPIATSTPTPSGPTATFTRTPTPSNTPTATNTPANSFSAASVSSAITIDGNLNEAAWSLGTTANKTLLGSPNNTVTFGALWDATYFYVGVKVLDANLYNDSANVWDDDSTEVYIDANHNHSTSYDSYDRQFVKGYNDSVLGGIGSQTGVLHAWTAISGGYSVELAIPWSNLNVTPTTNMIMGFDIGNNDDDNAGGRDSQLVWWGDGNNYASTANFGHVVLTGNPPATATPTKTYTPTAIPTVNLALNKSVTSSSDLNSSYAKTFAVDGNQATYWESAAGFAQTLTVDLGTNYTVSQVVLKLPVGWGSRTQTLSILGSTDNSTYTTIVASTVYTFSPSANTVTINFTGTSRRYIRLNITTNSGASGAQIAELEIY